MRAVVQRVHHARVAVDGHAVSEISRGVVVLLGVAHDDDSADVAWMGDKVANLRIFSDPDGKMSHSLSDVSGEVLLVSQFTLYADARKGRRPSFVRAGRGSQAEALYQGVVERLQELGVPCATGRFGAHMSLELTGDGPVTILLDSEKAF